MLLGPQYVAEVKYYYAVLHRVYILDQVGVSQSGRRVVGFRMAAEGMVEARNRVETSGVSLSTPKCRWGSRLMRR